MGDPSDDHAQQSQYQAVQHAEQGCFGQILETHMGWAARGLGIRIDEALKEYRRSGDMTPVREAVRYAYGDETYEEAFAGRDAA